MTPITLQNFKQTLYNRIEQIPETIPGHERSGTMTAVQKKHVKLLVGMATHQSQTLPELIKALEDLPKNVILEVQRSLPRDMRTTIADFVQEVKKTQAAVQLQSLVRGFQARKQMSEEKQLIEKKVVEIRDIQKKIEHAENYLASPTASHDQQTQEQYITYYRSIRLPQLRAKLNECLQSLPESKRMALIQPAHSNTNPQQPQNSSTQTIPQQRPSAPVQSINNNRAPVVQQTTQQQPPSPEETLKRYNRLLNAIEEEVKQILEELENLLAAPQRDQNRINQLNTRRDELNVQYQNTRLEKFHFIRTLQNVNPVVSNAKPSTLKAGTILYSANGIKTLESFIQGGILPDTDTEASFLGNNPQGQDNYAENMFGKGLYVSSDNPAYQGILSPHVIVFEVIEDIQGVDSPPLVDYLPANRHRPSTYVNQQPLTNGAIFNGWAQLQTTQPFIRHEGISGNNTEIVFRNPQGKLRVVGIFVNPVGKQAILNLNPYLDQRQMEQIRQGNVYFNTNDAVNNFTQNHNIPTRRVRSLNREENLQLKEQSIRELQGQNPVFLTLDEFCQFRNIQPNPQWKNISVIPENRQDRTKLSVNGQPVFFKKLRGNGQEQQLTLEAEKGGSKLASRLIGGNLVPVASELTFRGVRGIAQPFKNIDNTRFDKIALDTNQDFDPTKLNQKQLEQLFAHQLVDWILCNHDTHYQQFALDPSTQDVLAFDKGEAYKYFKGTRVQSAAINQGPEASLATPKFYQISQAPGYFVYPTLRKCMIEGKVKIDIDRSQIIQQTLNNISNLSLVEIEEAFGGYAKLAYPGREQEFYRDVLERAQSLRAQVAEFKQLCPPVNPSVNVSSMTVRKTDSIPQPLNGIPFSSLINQIGRIPTMEDDVNHSEVCRTLKRYFSNVPNKNLQEPAANIQNHFGIGVHIDGSGNVRKWASGIILQETDGRIWIRKVAGNFGGYTYSLPKGTLVLGDGLSLQQNALKELYEETGMTGEIQSFFRDNVKDSSIERYYIAKRTGGTPTDAGYETEFMMLVTPQEAEQLLNNTQEKELCRQVALRNQRSGLQSNNRMVAAQN